MLKMPPLAIPVLIVMAVAMTGAFIAFIRDRRRYAGYRDLVGDILRLCKKVNGEVFRDGENLVVIGTWQTLPVELRLSHAQDTPGLNLRVGAPAGFTLFCNPRSAGTREGKYPVRTDDERFSAHVETRSNEPTEAQLFLGQRDVIATLQKLCQSTYSFLQVTPGKIELIDLRPPDCSMVRTATAQLASLQTLAERLSLLPGADRIAVETFRRERHYLLRLAIVAGVGAALAAVLIAVHWNKSETAPVVSDKEVAGAVRTGDGVKIPGYQDWRVADASVFDAEAVAWLRAFNKPAEGRIAADFSGKGADTDVAYMLIHADGTKRVVMLCRGESIYDTRLPSVVAIARVPKAAVSGVSWAGTPPRDYEGDGLLIVRNAYDPASGLVIFSHGDRTISATPADYRSIRLD